MSTAQQHHLVNDQLPDIEDKQRESRLNETQNNIRRSHSGTGLPYQLKKARQVTKRPQPVFKRQTRLAIYYSRTQLSRFNTNV